MLKIGASRINITPNEHCMLEGYLDPIRENQWREVKDDLTANCICIESNDQLVLLISAEILHIREAFSTKVKKAIINQISIPDKNIIINATHTHCAPRCNATAIDSDFEEIAFDKQLLNALIQIAKEAYLNREEAYGKIRYGNIEGYYGNRNQVDAYSDKHVYYIEFFNKHHNKIASIFNMSTHSTLLDATQLVVSGDMIGNVARKLSPMLPILMMQGAAADMSTRFYRQGSDYQELMRVTDEIVKQILTFPIEDLVLAQVNIEMIHKVIHYNNHEYKDEYDRLIETQNNHREGASELELRLIDSIIYVLNLKKNKEIIDLDVKMYMITIGELIIVTFPGELETKAGYQLKKAYPGILMIATCTDDYLGYMMFNKEKEDRYEAITSAFKMGQVQALIEMWKERIEDKCIHTKKKQ